MNYKSSEREIGQYRIVLDRIKEKYPYLSAPRKPPLTIPTIFGKSYDENFISDYLAYILHPQKNGIGIKPLLGMLNLIAVEIEVDDPEVVEITREYYLNDYGRIDLLILIDKTYAVGIENKIFSTEGVEQTKRYVKALEKELADYQRFFVFLTPTGSQPGSRKFKPVSYRQLLHKFRTVQYDWAKDVRKSVIWEDFLTHLEYYITMSKENLNISEKGKLYIEHFQMIEDIRNAYEQDAKNIFDYVVAQIQKEITGKNWIIDFKDSRFYQQIYKKEWQTRKLFVHYEYFFNLDTLARSKFQFMVHVEGKGRNPFFRLFETEYAALKAEYEQKGLEYCPPYQKNALAWKEYDMAKDVENIEQPLILALREFSFLTKAIDRVFEKLGAAE